MYAALRALADQLPNHIELALKRHLIRSVLTTPDEDLAYHRSRGQRSWANARIVSRHFSPTKNTLAFLSDASLEEPVAFPPALVLVGQKDHSHGVVARTWESKSKFVAFALKEEMRDLQKNARAISGIWFTAAGPAVFQLQKDFAGLFYDLARARSLDVDNKAQAARIVFVPRIVKTLLQGRCRFGHVRCVRTASGSDRMINTKKATNRYVDGFRITTLRRKPSGAVRNFFNYAERHTAGSYAMQTVNHENLKAHERIFDLSLHRQPIYIVCTRLV